MGAYTRWLRILMLASATISALSAQMVPDAPLRNFRFPVFGEDGYKVWELQGVEGRYISESESVIFGLDLKTFSADEAMVLENRLRSPRAHVFLDETRAEGDSSIFFSGPNFILQGEGWTWNGQTRTMHVFRRARVIFNDEIKILK